MPSFSSCQTTLHSTSTGSSHPSPRVHALGLTDSDSPADPDAIDAQPDLPDTSLPSALDHSLDLPDDTCDLDF